MVNGVHNNGGDGCNNGYWRVRGLVTVIEPSYSRSLYTEFWYFRELWPRVAPCPWVRSGNGFGLLYNDILLCPPPPRFPSASYLLMERLEVNRRDIWIFTKVSSNKGWIVRTFEWMVDVIYRLLENGLSPLEPSIGSLINNQTTHSRFLGFWRLLAGTLIKSKRLA